jgi:hypothetical protein
MSGAAVLVSTLGCAAAHGETREATPEELAEGRRAIASLRASVRTSPYVARIALTMVEPRSGRTLDARGAVAIDPGRALRMILVGPGGATALDAWVTPAAWRFAVPALELVKRGTSSEGARGLPVGFFRWWFLTPLDGDVIRARGTAGEGSVILRRGDVVADVRYRRGHEMLGLGVERRASGDVERLEWLCASLEARAGDRGTYVQPSSGLRVAIEVEAIAPEPPAPESFVDPDAAGGAP